MSETMSIAATSDATALRIVPVREDRPLADMAPAWNALAGEIPFRRWEWAETWWRHYRGAQRSLLVLSVIDEQGELVGVAPWYVSRSPLEGRVVRFLGSGEVCSDYLTILVDPERAEEIATRIADWLAGEGKRHWDLLDLTGVEQSDGVVESLERRLAERDHLVERRVDANCWRTELSENWDAFLATLSKSRRARTRALLRRTIENGRALVHEVKTEADLERAYPILVELHQKRRRSLSQAGCFASARFTAFHREMAGRLLAAGQLKMSWTELNGRPMAVQYNFAGGDTVYYYQGGFEPELADDEPGWLSVAASLKSSIEEGYRGYDFLRGNESYKASWRAAARPLVRVRIVARKRAARVRYSTRRVGEEMKGWARQLVSRFKGS